MAVSSRIFGIKINGKKTDCLAPLADMLNHKRPRHTLWFYSDKHRSFIIQALQEIESEEQVYDSYGKKCNSRFLLNYGFIVDNNESNEYPFTLELKETDPLYTQKIRLLNLDKSENKDLKKTIRVMESFTEQTSLDLFSYLRFINYNE